MFLFYLGKYLVMGTKTQRSQNKQTNKQNAEPTANSNEQSLPNMYFLCKVHHT